MPVPEIKNYYAISPDCFDIDDWTPDDPENVDLWLRLCIGESGKDGADFYDVHVVTQTQLSQVEKSDYMHIIPLYSSSCDLINELMVKVDKCHDVSWVGVQEQLRKIFHWEYESMC